MKRILGSHLQWPLHDRAATRQIEAAACANLPPQALMQRAGAAVARLALAMAPHARRIGIVAGGGNNGGDGIEAARCLQRAGKPVDLVLCADPQRLPPDAAATLDAAREAGVPMRLALAGDLPDLSGCDLLIDALLGIGARGALSPAMCSRIAQMNAWPAGRLAIDVPSGLDANSGQPLGGAVLRADATLTLLTLKPGLFTASGRDAAGEVWLDSLGVDGFEAAGANSAWLLGRPPSREATRRHASHKGSFGDVGIVGGAGGMIGAALLAGRAALAAGAGRVFVDLLGEPGRSLDPQRPELMLRPGHCREPGAPLARMTLVVGCGGGAAVADALPAILAEAPRVVADADALNAIAADSALLAVLRGRADRGQASVLTPHPLEAARLLGLDAAAVQADRIDAVRRLAEHTRSVVVLKGSGSLICAPGGIPGINPTGSAALATGGTGDVLAGWLGGLWSSSAAHAEDAEQCAVESAKAAVWMHGDAADRSGQVVMRADELIEHLARFR